MKIYISAPISGVADHNRKLFSDTEEVLRAKGYDVVNPLSFGENGEWLDCMLRDLSHLRTCDAVLMLGGWCSSYGCRIEYMVALKLRLKVFYRLKDL